MGQELTGIIPAIDRQPVGVTLWTLILGHWRAAAGGAAASIGSLPMFGSSGEQDTVTVVGVVGRHARPSNVNLSGRCAP